MSPCFLNNQISLVEILMPHVMVNRRWGLWEYLVYKGGAVKNRIYAVQEEK